MIVEAHTEHQDLLGVGSRGGGEGGHLLGVDDLKPLLHLAALVAPALLVGHQRDVRVLWDALLAVTAVHTAAVLLIAQVVVAEQQRGDIQCCSVVHAHRDCNGMRFSRYDNHHTHYLWESFIW